MRVYRLFCLVCLLLFSAVFASCKGEEKAVMPPLPFTAQVEIGRADGARVFTLRVGEGETTLTNKDGVVYLNGENGASVRADGLTLPLDEAFLPDRGVLFRAFFPHDDADVLFGVRSVDGMRCPTRTQVREKENVICLFDETGRLLLIDREGDEPLSIRFL